MLSQLTYWHWFILGALLIILEVFAPGAFLLWIGIAAGVVGVILYAVPTLGWEYQVIIFSVVSVGSIVAWKRYRKANPEVTDEPTLNRRGSQYVGRTFTLTTPSSTASARSAWMTRPGRSRGRIARRGRRSKLSGLRIRC